jgi:signal transduction histidine kinase
MESNLATFSARARVIDLLGREQIADAPTAISELLKNSIDAGAKKASIRYNREDSVLEIEDTGLGMRKLDLLSKWLVVATDSKRGDFDEDWLEHATSEQRKAITGHRPFGEKGIGRLAVSSLGRAVLVWTRWGEGKSAERTMMLVHWDLFKHPKLTLEEIKIPYVSLGSKATAADAKKLMVTLANWLKRSDLWVTAKERSLKADILEDLNEHFPASVDAIENFSSNNGTLFAVLGTTPEVDESLRKDEKNKEGVDVAEGVKTLLAFSDPFGTQARKLEISVKVDGTSLDTGRDFWSAKDLKTADHELNISVSEDGFATGEIRRFSEKFEYKFQTSPLGERSKIPGAFKIVLGYVPGKTTDSRLPEIQQIDFNQRLKSYGALYIYRDGVRLLPYGRADHDFLEFEFRRTLNAGRYFFSHRRMFGAVYLSGDLNTDLREKAGREGFIQNAAYRGFKKWLIEIFIDVADTYFGTNPLNAKPENKRAKRRKSAAERQKERAEEEKAEFLRDLETWRRRLPLARQQMDKVYDATAAQLKNAETEKGYSKERMQGAYKQVDECSKEFANLAVDLGTIPPRLSALSRAEQQNFDSYLTDRQNFEEEAIKRIAQFSARCAQVAQKISQGTSQQVWLKKRINEGRETVNRLLTQEVSELAILCDQIKSDEAVAWAKSHENSLNQIIIDVTSKLDEANEPEDSPERLKVIVEAVIRMEIDLREIYLPFWKAAKAQIENLSESEGNEETLGDLQRRSEVLEEQNRVLGELAQLGLIVESLDHEFKRLFYNADLNLRNLANYVKPEGKTVLTALSLALRSMEAKQNMLSPLHQRKTSDSFDVSGTDIQNFIDTLHPESQRLGTIIEYTPQFLKLTLKDVNQATILASLANLILNSLYWVTKSANQRRIRIGCFQDGIIISDSGPGIAPRDRQRVFEAFFGRRPNGRGLGLYIAKTNLEAIGYNLRLLDNPPKGTLSGATFLLSLPE